ncbi:hypothetical protein ABIF70_005222 [Bradyrhizobium japonicum]
MTEARVRVREFHRCTKLLEGFSGRAKSAGNHVSWFAGGLMIAGGGVIALEPAAKVFAGVLMTFGICARVVSRVLGFIFRDRDVARPLDIARALLQKRLELLPQNILVVIDDIDRLEPEQILFRHIKREPCWDQRNIAFGGTPGDGRIYLEGVVQAACDVPVVKGAPLGNIVLSELNKVTEPLPTDRIRSNQVGQSMAWRDEARKTVHRRGGGATDAAPRASRDLW